MSNGKKAIVFRINDHGQGPEIVRQVFLERGWLEYDEDTQHESDWNIWWRTSRFRISDYENIFPWQRLNHYPKSTGITKKDCLVRNLRRMRGVHGAGVFNFSPVSFNLPNDYTRYVAEYGKLKAKTDPKNFAWICKPADMSRGRGIFLFRDISELQYDCNAVVQQYISNPLLIGGYKFDIRIYVTVPSFHPLTVYIFQEGLVRFSTEKFDLSCLQNVFSHLTNTSINKHSPSYTADKERIGPGCKWTLTQLRYYLHQHNLDDSLLWARVITIVILTLLIQAPQVPKEKNCYELYGFDILVDENLKPWLLEVNFSPALNTDCQPDVMVKKPMLHDLMDMMNFKDSDAERGGLDKRFVNGNNTARGRKTSGRKAKGDPLDRTMSSSRLSHRGSIQRINSTVSSVYKNIEPPVLEQTLSFIQQENPAIQKQEEKLCFGLPLIHPSDDEKNDSDDDCNSGRHSQKSDIQDPELFVQFSCHSSRYNTTSTTLTSFDKVGSFEYSSLSSAMKKAESVQSMSQRSEKTSLQSYGNSDSAYSSFSDNSDKVTVTSTNGRSKIYSNRQKNYSLQTEVLSETPRDSQAFQIKSLRPTQNSKSLKKVSDRGTTPIQRTPSSRFVYNPRNTERSVSRSMSQSVMSNVDRTPSRNITARSQSRFGNSTYRSDNDLGQRVKHGTTSSLSTISKLKEREMIDLGLKGTIKKTSPTPKAKLRSRSMSIHNKPKGPPPIVGNFFLVFPFNEGTLKAANTTLDPHYVIKETQKLVKDMKVEIDKNVEGDKKETVGGLLPYGAPATAERLWAPVKPPPEED